MRTDWYQDARFGMFLHWGLYSAMGVDEWVRSQKQMTVEAYAPCLDLFTASNYDPAQWAKTAKQAGMKYMVLTAKHHDGFCLFDSKLTDYKATNSAAGRDLVREFVTAARAEGLRVGLYYSLLDWHHPDYPKYGDKFHPMRDNPVYQNETIHFDNYLRYLHGQVEELVTNYGKIDLLWFDFSYGDLRGEAWQASKLIEMVRSHQPDVIIDNRLEGGGGSYGSLMTDSPAPFAGDFVSPEHHIPLTGIRKPNGTPVPWEMCTTCNNHWCYVPSDHAYKTPVMLVHALVECVSKDGNMILNVGPKPDGTFPEESQWLLARVGEWMQVYGESIYGCGSADLPKPDWGRYTSRGNMLYAHIMEAPIGPIPLTGVDPCRIRRVTRLKDNVLLPDAFSFAAANNTHTRYITFGDNANRTYPLPDDTDTVLKIELENR